LALTRASAPSGSYTFGIGWKQKIGGWIADLRWRHGVNADIDGGAARKDWCRKQDSNL
jgi:hypothetical protein